MSIHSSQSSEEQKHVDAACELMVSFIQARREAAEKTAKEAQNKEQGDAVEDWQTYKMERFAGKLLDFYRTKEKLIVAYAEAKKSNAELAELLEQENKELYSFYQGARRALATVGDQVKQAQDSQAQ